MWISIQMEEKVDKKNDLPLCQRILVWTNQKKLIQLLYIFLDLENASIYNIIE